MSSENGSAVDWVARMPLPASHPFIMSKVLASKDSTRILYLNDATGDVEALEQSVHPDNSDKISPVWLAKFDTINSAVDDAGKPYCAINYCGGVMEVIQAEVAMPEQLEVAADGAIDIPEFELRHSIELTENLIDVIALVYRGQKNVSNPRMPIALVAENAEELEWLNRTRGIRHLNSLEVRMEDRYHFDLHELPGDVFSDRIGGVELLSDAISQEWPPARYRELIRYFEYAFRLASGRLAGPLIRLLAQSKHGFKPREVDDWIKQRGAVIHGDVRTDEQILNVDVSPIVERMELAALEVLIYKGVWRSPSGERRSIGEAASRKSIDVPEAIIQKRSTSISFWPALGSAQVPINFMSGADPTVRRAGWWQKPFEEGEVQ
ncbi:hypothetical protein [Sinomonas sp. RB5]